MKIGVDLRVLQIGHQYRGIGEVAKRTLNHIFKYAIEDGNEFVFYTYTGMNDPKELLDLPNSLKFKEVSLGAEPSKRPTRTDKTKLNMRRLFLNPIPEAKQCDVFLQYDYSLGVPTNTKTLLIKHDIIPYVFRRQYLESAWIPFKNRALRTWLRTLKDNYSFIRVLKRSLRNANKIVCVSEYTRQDIHRHLKTPLNKMNTIHLGVSKKEAKNTDVADSNKLPTKPYLLFVGAIDARRRAVDDLVAAFNNLKAQGRDIQLVLAGENFKEPASIPNEVVRSAVIKSSYRDDILTLGYIDDATKKKLYEEAIAFVFPTIYEGFGIPVLEAMLFECPVVTYKNSSIPEVGGNYVLYAHDWVGIWRHTQFLLSNSKEKNDEITKKAKLHAEGFSWEETSKSLYGAVCE